MRFAAVAGYKVVEMEASAFLQFPTFAALKWARSFMAGTWLFRRMGSSGLEWAQRFTRNVILVGR